MRRDPLPWLLVLLLLLLAGIAWLTRAPESPVLDRLVELPVIGPAADWFRGVYRQAPAPPAAEESAVEVVIVGREIVGPPPAGVTSRPMGRVWVRGGARLHQAPDSASPIVETLAGIRTMALVERRGDWRRVSRVGLRGSLTEGWVRQADLGEPSPEVLLEPDPVVPLPASRPAEDVVAQAGAVMGDEGRDSPCGPYRLITDVAGPLVESCPVLAGQLDRLYARRTGLEPVGEPAEAILLFDSDGAFLLFRSRISSESLRHAFAAPAQGYVAVDSGGRPVEQVQAALVHELVHLLNRRFLGPALPSWLDEGLAEEMAMSRIASDGTLEPATLGSWESGPEDARLMGGGRVALGGLRTAMRGGGLPTLEALVRLDRAGFQAEDRFRIHYSLSAFWVRYLLGPASPERGQGFRRFLTAVASGRPLDETLLLASLGTDWPELESGFRRWLDSEAATFTTGS